MSLTPDLRKFCADLYATVHQVAVPSESLHPLSAKDLCQAVVSLKNHWQESTEGKRFSLLSNEERERLGNDVTRLFDIVEKEAPQEVFLTIAELYSKAAWIQSGHTPSSGHSGIMKKLGALLRQVDVFQGLSADMRASVEVAEARCATGEKKFSSELRIWCDEVISSLESLSHKLSSTDKAVVLSAIAKAKRKLALEYEKGLPDPQKVEDEMTLLQHELSEHLHKRGGEKSLKEANPENPFLLLFQSVKKSVEELKLFIKRGQVSL